MARRLCKKSVLLTRGPYKGFRVFGPYESSDGKRLEYRLTGPDAEGKTISVSAARFTMEHRLGRRMAHFERVFHLDGNPKNNRMENLKLVERKEFARLTQSGKNIKKS